MADNVFAKVSLVKLEQQICPPFSPDEIRRLLGTLDRTNLPGCRNHALILFLLDTGVRVSECVSIRLDGVCQISDNQRSAVGVLISAGWLGRRELPD